MEELDIPVYISGIVIVHYAPWQWI